MDIETKLRRALAGSRAPAVVPLDVWINDEGRVVVSTQPGDDPEYVVVGDKLIPWPVKPPPQRLGVEGFDSHQGMGGTK